MPEETSIDEQYRNHSPLEGSDAGAQNATPVGSHSPECGSQHGLREGTGGHPDDSRDTRPDRATRFVETAFGILSYSQLAPLLGERVTHLEESVQAEEFRSSPLDEKICFLSSIDASVATSHPIGLENGALWKSLWGH